MQPLSRPLADAHPFLMRERHCSPASAGFAFPVFRRALVATSVRRAFLCAAALLVPLSALLAPTSVTPAAAVTPGVGFTADPRPTYQINGISWAAAQARGVVYVGRTFSSIRPPGAAPGRSETAVRNFVALNAATGAPTSCRPAFTGARAAIWALAMSPDGQTLYAGGRFSRVNAQAVNNLAAINLRTCSPIARFRPNVDNGVRGLAVARNGTVYLAGQFLTVNGKARRRFAAVAPTGSLTAWSPVTDGTGFAVAVAPNGVDVAIVNPTSGAVVHPFANQFVPRSSRVKTLASDASGLYTGNEGTGTGIFDGRIALDPRTYKQRWRDLCLGATQDVL